MFHTQKDSKSTSFQVVFQPESFVSESRDGVKRKTVRDLCDLRGLGVTKICTEMLLELFYLHCLHNYTTTTDTAASQPLPQTLSPPPVYTFTTKHILVTIDTLHHCHHSHSFLPPFHSSAPSSKFQATSSQASKPITLPADNFFPAQTFPSSTRDHLNLSSKPEIKSRYLFPSYL